MLVEVTQDLALVIAQGFLAAYAADSLVFVALTSSTYSQ